ncbi:hypothetical protein SY2F82_26590 [Streptomyces sp. Y2F8-2]|nr:hypothetical protein SY2F82_26590 [Streptomyces sp. Y2F8-2]
MRVPCYEPRRHGNRTLCVVRGFACGTERFTQGPPDLMRWADPGRCDSEHTNHYVIVS